MFCNCIFCWRLIGFALLIELFLELYIGPILLNTLAIPLNLFLTLTFPLKVAFFRTRALKVFFVLFLDQTELLKPSRVKLLIHGKGGKVEIRSTICLGSVQGILICVQRKFPSLVYEWKLLIEKSDGVKNAVHNKALIREVYQDWVYLAFVLHIKSKDFVKNLPKGLKLLLLQNTLLCAQHIDIQFPEKLFHRQILEGPTLLLKCVSFRTLVRLLQVLQGSDIIVLGVFLGIERLIPKVFDLLRRFSWLV